MKIEVLQQHLKQLLFRHARLILTLLIGALGLLLYGTSLLSQATALSDTFVDIVIYVIYLLLVLVIAAMTYIVYYLFGHDPLRETATLLQEEKRPDRASIPEYKEQSPVVARVPSGREALGLQLDRAREALIAAPLKTMAGYALIEGSPAGDAVRYLEQQHPQIAAVTLLMLDPKKALDILEKMDARHREVLLARLEQSEPVSHAALLRLERGLQKEFFPLQKERAALEMLNDREIKAVLRRVTKKELMSALSAVTQELQEKFFANMSSKASGEFRRVMASRSASDPEKSQNALKNLYLLAEQLRDDGRIRTVNEGVQ